MKIILTMAGLLLLTACSRHEPEPDNFQVQAPLNATTPEPAPPVETVEPVGNQAAIERPPPIDSPSEQQVQEDADASGMTSRMPSRENSAPVASNAAQ